MSTSRSSCSRRASPADLLGFLLAVFRLTAFLAGTFLLGVFLLGVFLPVAFLAAVLGFAVALLAADFLGVVDFFVGERFAAIDCVDRGR